MRLNVSSDWTPVNDELPFDYGDTEPSLTVELTPRKHRHQWRFAGSSATEAFCVVCGKPKDEALTRRAKSAIRNGKDAERQIARDTGGKRVGHYGGEVDVISPTPRRFVIQSKRVTAPSLARSEAAARRPHFPEWMWDELRKLPVTGGDVPALVVSDKPGPGRPRRALVVVDYRDYVELYGEPE